MKIKGNIAGFKQKGEYSGLPEITISIPKMNEKTTIPLMKEVELEL